MARKKDTDVHALYDTLNGGVNFGATGTAFTLAYVAGAIARSKANKFGNNVYILHHPNAVFDIANTAVTASATYPVPKGWSEDLLGNFFSGLRPLNGVPIFEDGNLAFESNGTDAKGVIADKSAMAVLNSVETRTERQRDASMRATEVVMTSDYGVFELDDSRGAAMFFDATAPATSA
jgi:hypothetical protein